VLRGSAQLSDYPSFGYVHKEMGDVYCLLYAIFSENVSLEGEGCIDFNGNRFFNFKEPRSKIMQEKELTSEQLLQVEANYTVRTNQMLFFRKCCGVHVQGIRLENAACWGLVCSTCEEIHISGLTMRFHRQVPNADGIHLSACKNAIVTDCDIVGGDDCIAITCIDDWNEESNNILVANCLLSSSSAGVRIGYWRSVVRNVQIQNCMIYEANRGVCMMSCHSGLVENVHINGLQVQTKSLIGTWWGSGEAVYICTLPHEAHIESDTIYCAEEKTVSVRNVSISGLTATCENGIVLVGERSNIEDVRFFDMRLTMTDWRCRDFYGAKLALRPSEEERTLPQDGAYWLLAEDVKELQFTQCKVQNDLKDLADKLYAKLCRCEDTALLAQIDSCEKGKTLCIE
ncbi:MAG: glycosyl hydrolase family 28 protein, partial [Ruthenibacterium sp.]